jgi:hypothetical protein
VPSRGNNLAVKVLCGIDSVEPLANDKGVLREEESELSEQYYYPKRNLIAS